MGMSRMKPEKLTEIVCIIDRSGSMGSIRDDAIGRTINEVKSRINKTEDQKKIPGNVIVAILTDGEENASTEFNLSQIESMIKNQIKKDQWNFVYLSADPKAFEDAGKMGIASNNVVRFEADSEGIQDCCRQMNAVCCEMRAEPKPVQRKKK